MLSPETVCRQLFVSFYTFTGSCTAAKIEYRFNKYKQISQRFCRKKTLVIYSNLPAVPRLGARHCLAAKPCLEDQKLFALNMSFVTSMWLMYCICHVWWCVSDDMLIKLWDWEKKWICTQVFEGHTHYVMQIVINPKDNNTFASCSLDRTVKVWFFLPCFRAVM